MLALFSEEITIDRSGQSGRVAFAGFPYLADKSKPFACNGADEMLYLTTVADRLANGCQSAAECRLGNDPTAPNPLNQFFLADHAVTLRNKILQQVEDLPGDGDKIGRTPQLPSGGVQ